VTTINDKRMPPQEVLSGERERISVCRFLASSYGRSVQRDLAGGTAFEFSGGALFTILVKGASFVLSCFAFEDTDRLTSVTDAARHATYYVGVYPEPLARGYRRQPHQHHRREQ
jgi:hypothetical protein